MSTKTANLKRPTANGSLPAKNGKAASNGSTPKTAKRKKSMYENWIEKYGVSDSEADRNMLEIWKITYEAHNRKKS
jgi:hypothetical protein